MHDRHQLNFQLSVQLFILCEGRMYDCKGLNSWLERAACLTLRNKTNGLLCSKRKFIFMLVSKWLYNYFKNVYCPLVCVLMSFQRFLAVALDEDFNVLYKRILCWVNFIDGGKILGLNLLLGRRSLPRVLESRIKLKFMGFVWDYQPENRSATAFPRLLSRSLAVHTDSLSYIPSHSFTVSV